MRIESSPFGKTASGAQITLFTLTNGNGLSAKVITYGATLVSVVSPDRNGKKAEITLGYESLDGYLLRHPYFGSTVGRFANRIAKGRFSIDGAQYSVACNDGGNHLHGGLVGFDQRLWKAETAQERDASKVMLSYRSPAGEENYPGNLDAKVTYTLTEKNELVIEYEAETDAPTPVNLTNHTYWNLEGAGTGTIYDHILSIDAESYLDVDEELVPSGRKNPVAGGAFDFRKPKPMGKDIEAAHGYDHCFVLNRNGDKPQIRVAAPKSGRVLTIFTTQPGVQLYTSNFLDNAKTRSGIVGKHGAFCLETQGFPDAVNHPEFPDAVLRPGKHYYEKAVHRFGTDKEHV